MLLFPETTITAGTTTQQGNKAGKGFRYVSVSRSYAIFAKERGEANNLLPFK